MLNQASAESARQLPACERQRGAAIVEVLMLAVPLCVIIMVVTSKLAATSTARLHAQWQANLDVQQDTRESCGLNLLMSSGPVAAVAVKPKATKALLPLAFGADLLFTNDKTKKATVPVDDSYWFHGQATRVVPDGIDRTTAEATFLCNNNMGDNHRTLRGLAIGGLGFWQARKLFTGKGSDIQSPKDPLEEPSQDAKDQSNGMPKDPPSRDQVPGKLQDKIDEKINDSKKH